MVDAEAACHGASSVRRAVHRFAHVHSGLQKRPKRVASISWKCQSFAELYGRSRILEASSGCGRNLDVKGLHVLDLNTCKSDGTPGEFNLEADRVMARHRVENDVPTWTLGATPCTAFSLLNINLNYGKVAPSDAAEKLTE